MRATSRRNALAVRNVAVRFWRIVSSQRCERKLPHRQVLGRPDAGDRGADVHRAELLARGREEAVDVGLDRQVGLGDRRPADLGCDRRGPLLAPVVVHEHVRALGGEEPRAGGADPAGGTGDDDSFACETRVHEGVGYPQ